ncbi:MAG: hypothetical protein PHQ35_11315 [Phycisphaerae bacterium]|nr:hypothetical protein [Phycisphaerae bacterium]
MPLTGFPNGISSFGNAVFGSLGIGNVYYVVNTTSTTAYKEMLKRYGGFRYEDGSKILHPHTSTASTVTLNGLKSALAATVEDRNDYVVVMGANSTYYIDAALALNKKNVHIVCPAGMGYDYGATNAARIQQITASTAIFAMSDASIEIAGLYLKGYADASVITLAATSYAPNIHHNTFPLIWSSSPNPTIACSGDGGAWGNVAYRNWFISQAGDNVTCAALITVGSSATGAKCSHNEITIGDGNILTVGIQNSAVKGATDFNIFSESGGAAVSSGGTITKAIAIHATGSAKGNRGAVGTTQMLNGGTSAHSYCDNIGGVTGDAGQATQLES